MIVKEIFFGVVLAYYFLISLIFLAIILPFYAGGLFLIDVLLLLLIIDLKGGRIKCQKKNQ